MTNKKVCPPLLILAGSCILSGLLLGLITYHKHSVPIYSAAGDHQFAQQYRSLKSKGISGDWSPAHEFLKIHAKSENPLAKLEHAFLYLKGWGVQRDLETARLLLLQAVQYDFNDRGRAAFELGRIYRRSKGEDCHRIAFEWFSKALKWGYVKAHNEIGKAYARGLGVSADYNQSIHHYAAAIEYGSASAVVALFEIALLQQRDGQVGAARGRLLAEKYMPLLEQESMNDNRIAARALGRIYSRGLFTNPDFELAAKWFARASSLGDPIAMHDLAILELTHDVRGVDIQDTLTFLEDSAKLGYPAAMTALGRMYLKKGEFRDVQKAIHHLENGMKAGHAGSMAELAKLHFEGEFIPKDLVKAKEYAKQGALQKHKGCQKLLLKIARLEKQNKHQTKAGKV